MCLLAFEGAFGKMLDFWTPKVSKIENKFCTPKLKMSLSQAYQLEVISCEEPKPHSATLLIARGWEQKQKFYSLISQQNKAAIRVRNS